MKKILHIVVIALLPLLLACSKTEEVGRSQLVVEGWIENGGNPVVMVSESIGIATGREMDSKGILDHIAKWAKVSISDGTKTEILTGIPDPEYFPPYIYTTSAIAGAVGKTYTLKVEYKDYKVEASTKIPEPVPIDRVYVLSVKDSLAILKVGFTDPPLKGNNYKIFTRTKGKDTHFHPSAFTSMCDDILDGYTEIQLFSTQRLMDYIYWGNIHVGDELEIKLCSTDRSIYEYWNNFEVSLASNMFNMFYEHDMSNSMKGAMGYWAGYGVDKVVNFTVHDPNEYLEPGTAQ